MDKPIAKEETKTHTPIRVAQIMGKMNGGGVEAAVMNYYRNIDRSAIQFDFLIDSDSMHIPREEIEDLGGRVYLVPPYKHLHAYLTSVEQILRGGSYAIVHSHINSLSVLPLWAARRADVPVRIAHSHSTAGKGEFGKNVLKHFLKVFSNLYPTHRMACSKHAGEWLFGHDADFEILYNAIDGSSFMFNQQKRADIRNELEIADSTYVIGHVGRLCTQKNQSFLIDLFASFRKKYPDSKLILIGDGHDRKELEKKIDADMLDQEVLFLGYVDGTASFYSAFDVFVLPSLYEGLGMAGIEAQFSGLPCLFSDAVPVEAELSNNCVYLPIDDGTDSWVDQLSLLKSDMSEAALEKLRKDLIEINNDLLKKYDIRFAAKRLEELYLRMLHDCEVQ